MRRERKGDEGKSGNYLGRRAATYERLVDHGGRVADRGGGRRGGPIMTLQRGEELWIPLYEKD